MAGYVIHLAIANEYIRKNNVKNKIEIINGVIAPDEVKEKSLTHFGVYDLNPRFKEFLVNNDIKNNYNRGYFLHLITDYLFYNYYFVVSKDVKFYSDYDKTNEVLIKKYSVDLPEDLKKYMKKESGEPEYLKYDLLEKMIEEISNLNLEIVEKDILNNNYIMLGTKKVSII